MFNKTKLNSEKELEALLSEPTQEVVEMMKRLKGDIMILGIAGKIGISLGLQVVEAIRQAGIRKKVYGVSRFSKAEERTKLEACGIITIPCDLMEREQVEKLPLTENVIFMAGHKFGTQGSESTTWGMNVIAPALAAEHFKDSRITRRLSRIER